MSKKNLWIWVGVAVALVGVVGFLVFGRKRPVQPFRDSVARAQADARVAEVLGQPVEPAGTMSGSINTFADTGSCDLKIGLRGSKQNGTVNVVGTRQGDQWTYQRMVMTPDRGEPIDLLAGPPGTAPPTS